MRPVFLAAGICLAPLAVLSAQTWRSMESSRQVRDTGALSVRVEYAAGKLDLKPASGAALYSTSLRYDADRAEPVMRFDSSSHSLALGVRLRGMHLAKVENEHDLGSLHAELSGRVPMDLSLELGAVEANLQLGGLRLTDLTIRGGAAEVTARFDQPNREQLRTMTLEVGAAQVKLFDVANSGVSRISAEVGAGELTIDLGGVLTRDVEITATVAIGGLKLNISPDDGVFVDERSFIGGFDKDGFTKRADGWYSANYDSAKRRVRIHFHAFMGGMTLTRTQK